jgi:hypothetical protein
MPTANHRATRSIDHCMAGKDCPEGRARLHTPPLPPKRRGPRGAYEPVQKAAFSASPCGAPSRLRHLERENIRQSHASAFLPGAQSVATILEQAAARTFNIANSSLAAEAPLAGCPLCLLRVLLSSTGQGRNEIATAVADTARGFAGVGGGAESLPRLRSMQLTVASLQDPRNGKCS